MDKFSLFKDLLRLMSYYNAAESNWNNERTERLKCKQELQNEAQYLLNNNVSEQDIVNIIKSDSYLVTNEWKPNIIRPKVKQRVIPYCWSRRPPRVKTRHLLGLHKIESIPNDLGTSQSAYQIELYQDGKVSTVLFRDVGNNAEYESQIEPYDLSQADAVISLLEEKLYQNDKLEFGSEWYIWDDINNCYTMYNEN